MQLFGFSAIPPEYDTFSAIILNIFYVHVVYFVKLCTELEL